MASYVVTGVSKGLGYGFLTVLSRDPSSTVIGIVRNKPATLQKISEDAELKDRSNIHILEGDMTEYATLKKAAAEAAEITGGKVDYLIANAGLVSLFDAYDPIGALGDRPEEVDQTLKTLYNVNVIGNVHLYHLFMPMILKGNAKKVVVISSGFADAEFTNKYDVEPGSLYASSKAAMNMITAKFSAQYKKDGVLFLSVCPGVVDVGHYKDATPAQMQNVGALMTKFLEYAPHFKGPDTPVQSAEAVKSVWENATFEKEGGDFLSHFGNKQWL
ncbi:NAD(P)-binding protein [Sodiomyces alkalinus F11]|uniref:NAD(P)-binding protein n=1 Tax=Sodiomyces alkalinus (strain CBS 110278 / VKM F-3762 / F11) TaxID=1314773 RepID=A0A3N2PX42_SODAK|nr:NAD(P)-binding protein [Sodiomyces alkalinus F11]ROT38915.1 NAD(P)-binding protein [Sodiomyces alkalinus F11]